jgi:hypothetical protein
MRLMARVILAACASTRLSYRTGKTPSLAHVYSHIRPYNA